MTAQTEKSCVSKSPEVREKGQDWKFPSDALNICGTRSRGDIVAKRTYIMCYGVGMYHGQLGSASALSHWCPCSFGLCPIGHIAQQSLHTLSLTSPKDFPSNSSHLCSQDAVVSDKQNTFIQLMSLELQIQT